MSVFLKNTCDYSNCRKSFPTLSDLIIHIENDHLDFDPDKIEKWEEEKPDYLPLSYVLKFGGPDDLPRYSSEDEVSFANEAVIEEWGDVAAEAATFSSNYVSRDATKPRSDARLNRDEAFQAWGHERLFTLDNSHKKPFGCSMKGCEKRYKNVNGIKYHYKNHHKMLIPNFKKAVPKLKPVGSHVKPLENFHALPLYNYKPPEMYQNIGPNMHHFKDCEAIPNEYLYKFNMPPTSNVLLSSTQVPLPNNMSFNYYNIADRDIADFSGKNPNCFLPNFDRF